MRKLLQRPSPSMAVALASLVVALGGVGYAAIPDSTRVIHACYGKTGALRLIDTEADPPQTCKPHETSVDWPGASVPGPGAGTVSGLVRLSVGETKTVVQRGPFAITATCSDLGSNRFLVDTYFRSSEMGTAYDGVDPPLAADTPFQILGVAGTGETRDQTFSHIVAPSGATWALFASAGVHTFGSDCMAAATASGL
jgi:hypothetical protein